MFLPIGANLIHCSTYDLSIYFGAIYPEETRMKIEDAPKINMISRIFQSDGLEWKHTRDDAYQLKLQPPPLFLQVFFTITLKVDDMEALRHWR